MDQFSKVNLDQRLPEPIHHAVVAIDAAGAVTLWDENAEALLGWASAEILGQPFSRLLADAQAAPAIAHGSVWSGTTALLRQDRSQVVVRVAGTPVKAADGSAAGAVYVIIPAGEPDLAQPASAEPAPSSGADLDQKLHEQVEQKNSLLHSVLDTLPIGVLVVNRDMQPILSNPEEQRIWNLAGQSGQPTASSATSKHTPDSETGALARALQEGTTTLHETFEVESHEGLQKTILSSTAPIRNAQGEIIGGIAVHQDITEQRRIEEAERKHRTFANALSGITALLTSSLDLEVVMTRILDNVGRVVPHEAANIMLIENNMARIAFWHNYGPKCDQLFTKIRYSCDLPMLKRMLETGLPQLISDTGTEPEWVTFEETAWIRSTVGVPIRARDAIIGFLLLDSSQPDFFRPPDAERLRAFAYQAAIAIENARLFSTVQDYATELEARVAQRTAELRGAKDHVEAILEHSSDGFALVTAEGVIMQVNPSFRRLFGIDKLPDEILSLPDLIHPNNRERLMVSFHDARMNKTSYRIELSCFRQGGQAFDADVAISPLFDPTTKQYVYICNVRDVTPQKTAERELRTALEHEKQLSELKSRFIAMISHEFRTPLASIQMSSDLLNHYYDRISTERRGEIIALIQSHVRQLTALLEDVITVAKADTIGLTLEAATVDLVALCQEVRDELHESAAQQRLVEIRAAHRPVLAEVDAKLFRQVLTNLLDDAIKYSADDTAITLDLSSDDRQVSLIVTDRGIGIPDDDLPFLFDPFFRARNVGSREGSGLGLAIVKRIVEGHHGTVTVESQVGLGTRFTITIPKKLPAAQN